MLRVCVASEFATTALLIFIKSVRVYLAALLHFLLPLVFFLLESGEASFQISRNISTFSLSKLKLMHDCSLLQITVRLVFLHCPANVASEKNEKHGKEDDEDQDPIGHSNT